MMNLCYHVLVAVNSTFFTIENSYQESINTDIYVVSKEGNFDIVGLCPFISENTSVLDAGFTSS